MMCIALQQQPVIAMFDCLQNNNHIKQDKCYSKNQNYKGFIVVVK